MRAALTAELTKIRSVRSTRWALLATFSISAGLAYVICASLAGSFARMPLDRQRAFDPLYASSYSLTIGQLAVVAFGVLVIGAEYSSGTLSASLAAMPNRGRFYGCKLAATALVAVPAAAATALASFFAGQAALGSHRTTLTAPGSVQAVLGGCLYLVLICLLATGVATALRGTAKALGILLPLLLVDAQGLANVPVLKPVLQYLPDQAGQVISPQFGRPYGPWAGVAILALWVAVALAVGYLVLDRADVVAA
jgi:ABC-2 type transport system permease protein